MAENKGDVAKAAEIRYGSLKYLEQQRATWKNRPSVIGREGTMVPDEVLSEHIAEVIADRVGCPPPHAREREANVC